jgi:hypothetical protein
MLVQAGALVLLERRGARRRAGREADLQAELERLFNEQNTSEDGATSIPATFLRVMVRR